MQANYERWVLAQPFMTGLVANAVAIGAGIGLLLALTTVASWLGWYDAEPGRGVLVLIGTSIVSLGLGVWLIGTIHRASKQAMKSHLSKRDPVSTLYDWGSALGQLAGVLLLSAVVGLVIEVV